MASDESDEPRTALLDISKSASRLEPSIPDRQLNSGARLKMIRGEHFA